MTELDLLIVGGGPAGWASARALALRGQRAVVLEKRPGVQDKVCGEGVMPTGLRALETLGVQLEGGLSFRGICYRQGPLVAAADFAEGPGRAVRRTELSAALAAGLERECEQVERIRRLGSAWELQGRRRLWRAKRVVVADGLHSTLRAQLGWSAGRGILQRWGWRQHFETAPWSDRVEVWFGGHTEAYVTPVAPGVVNVAVLGGKTLTRRTWLDAFPDLRDRLGAPLTPLRGYGPLWQRTTRVEAPGLALVGDAAGYLDACTGEGISLALHQALALAEAWSGGEPYSRAVRRLTRPYQLLTGAVLLLGRSTWATALALRLLQRRPRLFQELLSLNQGLGSLRVAAQLLAGWPGPDTPIAL